MQQNLNPQLDGGDEDFASLFEASLKERGGEGILKEGDLVKGTVVQVTKDYAVVDIGYKSEGQIPISEFTNPRGEVTVKDGDPVEVLLESRENDTGMVVLSKEKADKMRIWDEISAACERDEIVKGVIVGRVKGGLSVDIGVKAFLPGSQVDIRPVRNLDQYISKEFEFKVIKFNKKRGNIVLSRRVLLEKQREELKKETLKNLKEGAVLKGVVKNLTDYGAFIDLGGIDGLLHITDMSWGRIGHPSEMFNVGDEVRVVVLKFDPTQERVSLGLKQIQEDPWHRADEKYPVGTRVQRQGGQHHRLRRVRGDRAGRGRSGPRLRDVLDQAPEAPVQGARGRPGGRGGGAGHRSQGQAHRARHEADRGRTPGRCSRTSTRSAPSSRARSATSPTSASSSASRRAWTVWCTSRTSAGPSASSTRASCSRRAMKSRRWCSTSTSRTSASASASSSSPRTPGRPSASASPWAAGSKGKVTKVTDFGAFVEIEPGIEGLVHVSELKDERVENPRDVVSEGQDVAVKIIDINTPDRKVALSMKALLHEGEDDYREYLRKQAEGSKARLGDVMASKLRR